MKQLNDLLKSNSGDENVSALLWVAIAFVVGAILLILISSAFQGPIHNWFEGVIKSWFNENNGDFTYGIDNSPGDGFDGPGDSLIP